MAASQQSLLDRIPGKAQKLLDRIPGGAPAIEPVGPVMADARSIQPKADLQGGTLAQVAHGAVKGFSALPELGQRIEDAYTGASTALLARIFPALKPAVAAGEAVRTPPGASEQLAQDIAPIGPDEQGTVAGTIGQVAGGMAQLPILGTLGLPGVAAGFGGQSGLPAWDDAKANGASDTEAAVAAAAQGGLSAASVAVTGALASKLNVGSWLSRVLKIGASGAAVGQVEQTLSNGLTHLTAEKDREILTGLKGRAATDAAVGILMTALFPGHAKSAEVIEAQGKARPLESNIPPHIPPESTPPVRALAGTEALGSADPLFEQAKEITAKHGRASASFIQRSMGLGYTRASALADAIKAEGVAARQAEPAKPFLEELKDPAFVANLRTMAGDTNDFAPKRAVERAAAGEKLSDQDLGHLALLAQKMDAELAGADPQTIRVVENLRAMGARSQMKAVETDPFLDKAKELEQAQTALRAIEDKNRGQRASTGDIEERLRLVQETQRIAREMQDVAARQRAGETAPEGDTSFDPSSWETESKHLKQAQADEDSGKRPSTAGDPAASPVDVERYNELKSENRPPEPPPPPATPAEIPEPQSFSFWDILKKWRGDRWEGETWAKIKGAKRYAALTRTLNLSIKDRQANLGRDTGKQAQDILAYGMKLRLDAANDFDAAYARTEAKLPQDVKDALKASATLTPGQRALQEEIRIDSGPTGFGEIVKDAGLIQEAKDNFTRRMYEPRGEPGGLPGRSKFSTFSTAMLHRKYPTMLDAIADGWVPRKEIRSIIDAAMWTEIELTRVIAHRNNIEAGRKGGVYDNLSQRATASREGVQPHEAWIKIEHPNFKGWYLAGKVNLAEGDPAKLAGDLGAFTGEEVPHDEAIKLYGWSRDMLRKNPETGAQESIGVANRDMMIFADGRILTKQALYAPPEYAKVMNRSLSTAPFNAFDKVQTAFKHLLLKVPVIHTARVARHYLLGQAWDSVENANPAAAHRAGMAAIEEFTPKLRFLVRNGLQLGVAPEFSEVFVRERGMVGKTIDRLASQTKATEAAVNWIRNTTDLHAKFLFNKFTPALQGRIAETAFNAEIMRGATPEEAAVAGSRHANTMMGNLNFEALNRDPRMQRWLNRIFFAPMWGEANLRKGLEAFSAGATGHANRVVWRRLALRYAAIHTAANLASALLEDPGDPVGRHWKNLQHAYGAGLRSLMGIDITPELAMLGRTDPTRFYLGILGGYQDTALAASATANLATAGYFSKEGVLPEVVRLAEDKLNVTGRAAEMLLTGMDYRNQVLTSAREQLGVDDRGVYRTTRLGKYVAGMKKGGKLFGQMTSFKTAMKPGPIHAEQVPSWLEYQLVHAAPIHVQGAADWITGQSDGFEFALRNFFEVSRAKPEKPKVNVGNLFR